MKSHLRGWLVGSLAGLVLVLPALSGCGALGPTTSGSVWGLPYKTGTSVTLGCLGLHDDNIFADSGYNFTNQKPQSVTPAFSCPPPHVDDPTHANDASLDLLSATVGVPVIPLASGTVLIADEICHFVVVDHGNNIWVAYLHIDVLVTVNQQVTRDTVLGTTAVPHSSKCENSTAAHVHIAFINGSGHSGAYVSMVGNVLCGFQVIKNAQYPIGALQEVAHPDHIVAPGASFTVPDCAASTSPVASPTPSPTSLPTPNIAGDWQLSGIDPSTYSCNLTLQQDGTAITGGASCYNLNGITISGSLSGNHISLQGDDEFQPGDTIQYQFKGTVNDAANEMQGTYMANDPAGGVAPQGTWSATRST